MVSANPYRYAGYRYDEATGLYYLMSRYYDPGVGRFISRDTFHGLENKPSSLNQYIYCENDPSNKIDPDGHSWNFAAALFSVGIGIGEFLTGVAAAVTGVLAVAAVVATAVAVVSVAYNAGRIMEARKGKENVRDTGLTHVPDNIIQKRARDRSIPSSERQRYKKEEKARKLRNTAKRKGY